MLNPFSFIRSSSVASRKGVHTASWVLYVRSGNCEGRKVVQGFYLHMAGSSEAVDLSWQEWVAASEHAASIDKASVFPVSLLAQVSAHLWHTQLFSTWLNRVRSAEMSFTTCTYPVPCPSPASSGVCPGASAETIEASVEGDSS